MANAGFFDIIRRAIGWKSAPAELTPPAIKTLVARGRTFEFTAPGREFTRTARTQVFDRVAGGREFLRTARGRTFDREVEGDD